MLLHTYICARISIWGCLCVLDDSDKCVLDLSVLVSGRVYTYVFVGVIVGVYVWWSVLVFSLVEDRIFLIIHCSIHQAHCPGASGNSSVYHCVAGALGDMCPTSAFVSVLGIPLRSSDLCSNCFTHRAVSSSPASIFNISVCDLYRTVFYKVCDI